MGVSGDRMSLSSLGSQWVGGRGQQGVDCSPGVGSPQNCSLSTDQPDVELPVPQQALASVTHEHHIHHSAVLPLLPGCSCIPLLHHLVVSTHEATAQDTGPPAAWRRRGWGDHGPCPWHPPAAGYEVLPQAREVLPICWPVLTSSSCSWCRTQG